jgi:hypothetical protein
VVGARSVLDSVEAKRLADALALQRMSASGPAHPLLAGCWRQIDDGVLVTGRDAGGLRSERVTGAVDTLLRFIGPVATDMASPPAALPLTAADPARRVMGGGRGGRAAASAVPAAVINAFAQRQPDSTFVAELVSGETRTRLVFSVQGDTVRGTSRRSAGDVSYPAGAFVAVRTA